jgi:nitrate reductase gamma subunit
MASLLFHFGLYLAIVATLCAVLIAAAGLFLTSSGIVGIVSALAPLVKIAGMLAAAFIVAGALWLLVHRMADPGMKNSTHAGDIFNLLFFIAAFSLLIGGYLRRAPGTASLGEFAHGVVDFDRSLRIAPIFAAGAILAAALAAYIPFTHMAHFIAKYFTWHAVRWDDRRNDRGSAIERKISAALNYRPTWSAPHMGADGKRTWSEIAAVNPTEEKQR